MPTWNNSSTGRTGTIQSWTVDVSGIYSIEAYGARGSRGENSTHLYGLGAYIKAEFNLKAGDVLSILVGQMAVTTATSGNYAGGGGGASFVVRGSTPLLVAAGGNGGSWASHTASIPPALWTPFDSAEAVRSADGRGGSGATHSLNGVNGPGGATDEGGGFSFTNGGAGGTGIYASGGFGGGGGARFEGGGGGGWVGGKGPPTNAYSTQGLAAQSYSAGQNTTGTNGARDGHGQVIITLIRGTSSGRRGFGVPIIGRRGRGSLTF